MVSGVDFPFYILPPIQWLIYQQKIQALEWVLATKAPMPWRKESRGRIMCAPLGVQLPGVCRFDPGLKSPRVPEIPKLIYL